MGYGATADALHITLPAPGGSGAVRAARRALAKAGRTGADLDHINAHATSTLIGDISEARALKALFGEALPRVAVSSTKALTGHGLSLAGAMESAFCALALRDGFIPGNAHLTRPDPECAALNLPRTTEERAPRTVLKNSSGFGGANVALVYRRVA
mgnify:CR=1 FL=1